MMFDCTDTNSDGHISIEEFGVYFKTLGHDITDEEMKHPFDTIAVIRMLTVKLAARNL
jgi:Ca2+-binding EF-hand superfamily protein